MGCRTLAWAQVQATADSAWAHTAARAGCRRKVCGAAPQDVKFLEVAEMTHGPVELHVVGLDHGGSSDRRSVAK